jgi:hypothetical protein
MVPIRQPIGCSAAPNLGDRVRPTPGAEGTAFLLVGQLELSELNARTCSRTGERSVPSGARANLQESINTRASIRLVARPKARPR